HQRVPGKAALPQSLLRSLRKRMQREDRSHTLFIQPVHGLRCLGNAREGDSVFVLEPEILNHLVVAPQSLMVPDPPPSPCPEDSQVGRPGCASCCTRTCSSRRRRPFQLHPVCLTSSTVLGLSPPSPRVILTPGSG